jgi:hypothetical protein
MRAYEFTQLEKSILANRTWFDTWMEQYVRSGEITKEQIYLTEIFNNDTQKLTQVENFIALHKQNSILPVKGNMYAPIGFVLNAPLRRLQILSSEEKIELINIPRNYVFRCNGRIHTFPHEFNDNTSLSVTFFYDTIAEAQHMILTIMLSLQLTGWEVEQIVITDDGERIVQ